MRIAALLLALALLITPSARAETVPLGQPFSLAAGEFASVGELPLLVHFGSILMDSRCPSDVVCFWEGEATARVNLGIPGEEATSVELHTQLSPLGPSEAEFAGHVITLRRVDPYPSVEQPIDPQDYRVELIVELAAGVPSTPFSWSTLKARFSQ